MPILRKGFRESKAVRNTFEAGTKLKFDKAPKTELRVAEIKELEYKDDNGFALIEYEFKIDYMLEEPKGQSFGNISIIGEILYADKQDFIKNLVKEWKEDKKLDKGILGMIINIAMNDAQIEAIVQANKIGLPSPLPLPKLKAKSAKAA